MNIQLSDHFTYRRLLRFVFPSIIMPNYQTAAVKAAVIVISYLKNVITALNKSPSTTISKLPF